MGIVGRTGSKVNFFISPNEPKKVFKLCVENAIPDNITDEFGADFLLITNRGMIPIQRKTIPDLLASVIDGRLSKQSSLLRQSDFPIIIIEGRFRYSENGNVVIGKREQRWTRDSIRNLFRTLRYVEMIDIEFSGSVKDTISMIYQIQSYFDAVHHLSLRSRPSIHTNWIIPSQQERIVYFYQGLPGISVIRAKSLAEKFSSPLQLYQASVEEITEIPRFGQNIASRIYNFLREG